MASEEFHRTSVALSAEDQARRDFLKKAGRFAVLTPPTVTMLLSTSMNSNAIASSGGKTYGGGKPYGDIVKPKGNNGWGNGGNDGTNKGSDKGGGASNKGPNANYTQSNSKGSDKNR